MSPNAVDYVSLMVLLQESLVSYQGCKSVMCTVRCKIITFHTLVGMSRVINVCLP